MTERALIRSAAQVMALLAGATQIRVPVFTASASRPGYGRDTWNAEGFEVVNVDARSIERHPWSAAGIMRTMRCLLGVAGDRLWIRETWALCNYFGREALGGPLYRATFPPAASERHDAGMIAEPSQRRSSTTMPRSASRLALEVVEVSAQQAGAATNEDAIAEGATSRPGCYGYQHRERGWSMDWSRAGQPSRYAGGKPALDESDIAIGSPVQALANGWNRQYAGRKDLAWSPDLWTFVATVSRVQA